MKSIRNPNCKDCQLYKSAQTVCVLGQGAIPSDLMFIGEAPSFRDMDNLTKPFSGKAGRILDIILEEMNLCRDEVYLTNIMHCHPPENRKPSMDEMRACRKYLLAEIAKVKPKTLILLGDTAVKGLFDTNLMSIGKERGKVLSWEDKRVIVTYHPAAALRNQYYIKVILEDLHRGLQKETKTLTQDYQEVSGANRQTVLKLLKATDHICIDLETTGLDYMDPKLKIVSINTSITPGQSFVWPAKYLEDIQEILKDKKVIIGHNIKFDLQWLARYGIIVTRPIFDTMVAKHLLDENYPDKNLKHLANVDLNMHDLSIWSKKMEKHRKEGTEPSWREMIEYGARDSDATIRLWWKYSQELLDQGLMDLMRTEMKVLKTLTRMELYGMQIDLKEHKTLSLHYQKEIARDYLAIKKLVGEINLNSPKQLAELLYVKYHLPILNYTKNRAPSCDEATLQSLIELPRLTEKQKVVLESLLSYRNKAKLYSVYLDGLVKNNYLKSDGRIHCDFKICGTKTGRLSCAEPNLQNIPRNGDIKKMFISSFKGGKLIQLDYSQMELRILAHYANDKKLLQAFKENRDIHRETTAKCLNKPYNKVTEEERKVIGKRVNFGIVYLVSAKGLASKINCTEDEAKRYIRNWYLEFNEAKIWMDKRKISVISTGKSVSFNGRVRRLYGANTETPQGREAIRQGINSPIQGGAGDITKYAMMQVDRALRRQGLEARVTCNVHDSIMVDSPRKEVEECIKIMRKICKEPPMLLRVPLDFEIKVGDNWQNLEEVK